MDSIIEDRDAEIVVRANGREFTVLLVEDPRKGPHAGYSAEEILGHQIYGLLDHYCGWEPRAGIGEDTQPAPLSQPTFLTQEAVAANLDALRCDVVAGGAELSGSRAGGDGNRTGNGEGFSVPS